MRSTIVLFALVAAAPLSWAKGSHREDPDMTGKLELQMMQCPSAAPGASTEVVATRDGVELVVSAPTEFGRREIRRRAAVQQTVAAAPARGHDEHTGQGTGSGLYGYCPGMMQGTTLAVTDTDDGVRITVTARHPADVAELQRSARARAAKLRASLPASVR